MSGSLPYLSTVVASLSGFLFAIGWWCLFCGISSAIFLWTHLLAALVSLLGLLLLTTVSRSNISSDDMWGDALGTGMKRMILFGSVFVVLAGMGWSVTMHCFYYGKQEQVTGIVLQPIGVSLIAISSLLIKFGRAPEDDGF